MKTNNTNSTIKLALFNTNSKNIYAINITKIKAFIIKEDVIINDVPSESKIISGIATIRGEPITLVNIDAWLGNPILNRDNYKLIIYCEFNKRKIGILITEMINIVEKTIEQLSSTQNENPKTSYATYEKIANKEEYCTIFNTEQLLHDIGFKSNELDLIKFGKKPFSSNKIVLVAEDSLVSRDILINFFKAININYEIYNNGMELLKRINSIDINTISLIISDLEMPQMDGYQLVKNIKLKDELKTIPIIINSSSMTNATKKDLEKLGVLKFVEKTDLDKLYDAIETLI